MLLRKASKTILGQSLLVCFYFGIFLSLSFLVCRIVSADVSVMSSLTGNTQANQSSSCLSFPYSLSVGKSDYKTGGSDVTKLQQFLINQGYLNSALATGYFGSATRAGVILYQKNKGIDMTGIVGPITRAAIQSQTCGSVSGIGDGVSGVISTAPVSNTLTVDRFSSDSGPTGARVTVTGKGFDPYNNTIVFGQKSISNIPSATGTQISFVVPDLSATCPAYSSTGCTLNTQSAAGPGQYQIYISNSRTVVGPRTFTLSKSSEYDADGVTLRSKTPGISSIAGPDSLTVDTTGLWGVSVSDRYASPVTATVTWGDEGTAGESKSFVLSGQQLITFRHIYKKTGNFRPVFSISNDASGLGSSQGKEVRIIATTPSDSLSIYFNSVLPYSAPIGTGVMITGRGFSRNNNTVIFAGGAIKGLDSYNNGTALLFTVPQYVNPCDQVTSGYCSLPGLPITSGDYKISVINSFGQQTDSHYITVPRQ